MTSPRTFGRYELEEELGRGGMGIVYRARERSTGREVALKVLKSAGTIDETARRRFEREARLPARVRHPGIVEVLDAGTEDGTPFIALALVKGRPLSTVTVGLRQYVALLAKIARAVGTAHRAGVIHRDLKPSNVIVENGSGEPCLVDFGLAFDARLDASRLSRTGEVVGTPAYMAPEAFIAGSSPHDPRADVYALGMMLYERLNGSHPMKGLSSRQVIDRVAGGMPPLAVDADPFLARLAELSVSRNPGKRPADGIVFAEELERWLRGAARVERGPRHLRFVLAGAGVGTLILAGAVGATFLIKPEAPRVPVKAAPPSPPPAPPAPAPPPPPPPPAPSRRKMPPSEVADLEGKLERAMQSRQVPAILPDLLRASKDYPEDSRAVFFAAVGRLHQEGSEVDGRRELVRALSLRPDLSEGLKFHAIISIRAFGFDFAATAITHRGAPVPSALAGDAAKGIGMALLIVEPPYQDPVRSRELLEKSMEAGFDPWVPVFILHARFGAGERETLAAGFEALAERARQWDASYAEELLYRAQRCRAGAPAEKMSHLFTPSVGGTRFLAQLQREEQAWRMTWADDAGVEPARRLSSLARDELGLQRPDHAALAHFGAARALSAAGDAKGALASLRDGFEAATKAKVDVRALLARAFARALLAAAQPDAERAEKVARAAIADAPAGEPDARVQEELADGWLVLAEAFLARGKKAEAREAVAKGLQCSPFDKRPFEAVREKAR